MSVTIRFAMTAEVRPLRLEVLRVHTTNKSVDFEGDDTSRRDIWLPWIRTGRSLV